MTTKTQLAWEISHWFNTTGALSPKQLRGKVVVLHAFQMLCPGCVMHGTPQAQRLHQMFAGEELAVIGLHTVFEHHEAMTPEALEVFIAEFCFEFPIGVDAPSQGHPTPQTMSAFAIRGTPSLLLFDRGGALAWHQFGHVDDLAVGARIGGLLAGSRD